MSATTTYPKLPVRTQPFIGIEICCFYISLPHIPAVCNCDCDECSNRYGMCHRGEGVTLIGFLEPASYYPTFVTV
eukprot:627218-Rhodomonas_salina.1